MFKHEKILAVVFLAGAGLFLGLTGAAITGCQPDDLQESQIDVVAKNFGVSRTGLVVPGYMDITSIEEIDDKVNEIKGIDPGAGIMTTTQEAQEVYDLNSGLDSGSAATMADDLNNAIEDRAPIVVTGWTPHWKFGQWNLRYLEDPENVYEKEEYIASVARMGLQEELPEVYAYLENFKWGTEEINEVMLANTEEGANYKDTAREWVYNNQELVQEWIPDKNNTSDGERVEILYVEWDCAIASTYVSKAVLEDMGYDVNTTVLNAADMYSRLAEGDGDFITTAWLPATHEAYLRQAGVDPEDPF